MYRVVIVYRVQHAQDRISTLQPASVARLRGMYAVGMFGFVGLAEIYENRGTRRQYFSGEVQSRHSDSPQHRARPLRWPPVPTQEALYQATRMRQYHLRHHARYSLHCSHRSLPHTLASPNGVPTSGCLILDQWRI
jgi:hypothetical protein